MSPARHYLPKPYKSFKKRFPGIDRAYEDLALRCREAGPLDDKSMRLIKLGIAIGLNSEGAVKSHARRALDIGVSEKELMHVVLLALTTAGFPTMIAAMLWVEEVIKKQ
jgi:4-carboxymuconolactone decarboxylase